MPRVTTVLGPPREVPPPEFDLNLSVEDACRLIGILIGFPGEDPFFDLLTDALIEQGISWSGNPAFVEAREAHS